MATSEATLKVMSDPASSHSMVREVRVKYPPLSPGGGERPSLKVQEARKRPLLKSQSRERRLTVTAFPHDRICS